MDRRIIPALRLVAAGVLTLSLAGVASAADTAKVRVLHASPDAPAVDVYLDDAKVDALTNVPFATISGYLDIPAGDHNVKVYATGSTTDPVIDADVTVAAGTRTTIAATNAVASITAQVLADKPSPDCDTASVRVVHFSADAPAVDVATSGSAPADAVVKNLAYPNATGYVALPAGSYDLEVRLAGTTTVALPLPGVAVEACTAYSVFAIGSAASPAIGDNALQVVVAVDATASKATGLPPTDTVDGTTTTGGNTGLVVALLAIVGLLSFATVARRPVARRAQQDEG
ncbi:MAG TPA: DUF4397 domain-containing protein [Candidatus Limnocylindrales bacterium]|nr:DUF4397 domain-containing protein [Candidatus Limnocylindrales bacterium]